MSKEVIMGMQAISSISSSGISATAQALTQRVSSGNKTGGGGGAAKTSSASGSSSSSESSTTYDPMDLNKDGIVSPSERAIYLLSHPEKANNQNNAQTYSSQGTQTDQTTSLSGLINLSA